MIANAKKLFLIYLAVLSIAGGGIIYLATSGRGPGVSTDAAMMLSTAQNLLKGRGLVDYRGLELVQFPPLYSLILALGSLLFQQDVFVIGWAFEILVFAAILWCSGLYFYAAFEESHLLAFFASFIVASSTSLIQISSNIATDPLFLLIVIFFLICVSAYLRTQAIRYMVAAGVLTIFACFERYAGLALAITGGIVIAIHHRKQLSRGLLLGTLFSLGTALPISVWGVLHNAPVNGTVFGGRQVYIPLENLVTGVEKVLYWFVPLRIISFVGPIVLLAIILAVWLLLLFLTKKQSAFQGLLSSQVLPSAVFLVVYAAVLVFSISTHELRGLATDRVHIILLPSLLIAGGILFLPLLAVLRRKIGSRITSGLAILLFVAWSFYPLSKTYEYVRESMPNGDISSYNSLNKGPIRTSPLARYLAGLPLSDKEVYTNGSARAWYITGAQVLPLPQIPQGDRSAYLQQRYPHWPGTEQPVYMIWFKDQEYKEHYATPDELAAIARLQTLYSDADGAVYLVSQR